MKSFLLLLPLFMALVSPAQNKRSFTITGTINNIPNVEKVYLMYQDHTQNIRDSSMVSKGNYSFRGSVSEPLQALLRIVYLPSPDGKPRDVSHLSTKQRLDDTREIFVSPGAPIRTSSTGTFRNMKISGSPDNDEFYKLEKKLAPVEEKYYALIDQYMKYHTARDEQNMKEAEKQSDAVYEEIRNIYKSYVESNPASVIAPYALSKYASYDIDPEKLQPLLDKLSPKVKNFAVARDLAGKLVIARKSSIGNMAMDFTQNDTLGQPVSLSSFRGRVILLDFWASWCGPCRAENPTVVKAFNKYKDKNFYILSVSLDRPDAKDKWMKAIHEDNLNWAHVSDLKFWDNEVVKQYGIQAIPFNLLIDKEGKIIGRDLQGDALDKKLAEVL